MCGFSEIELVRLTRLRERFQGGAWPGACDGGTLIERHGIMMRAVPLGVGDGGVVRYRCILARECADGPRTLEALFQVMPVYPVPPEADEVLTWLAGCVANVAVSRDLTGWGLVHGIAAGGRIRALPYRGLFHEEADLGAFVLAQQRRASALREFLGPRAFAELLQEVGMV